MLFRTLIFVPSNNKRFVEKAKALNADIICFDLEDSVPANEKDIARQLINDALAQRTKYRSAFYVRINSLQSDLALRDLSAVVKTGIDGIVIPKVNDENEIQDIEHQVSTLEKKQNIRNASTRLIPSIESAKGVVSAYYIAKSSRRVNALLFGIFDFLHDMGVDYNEKNGFEQYNYARSKVPVDARAAGVESIDGIWQQVDDIEGLTRDTIVAKRLGYSGKSIIHPTHIDSVHRIFVPTDAQISWATKVVEALEAAMGRGNGRGAVTIEGKMVDAVHYKQAKAILDSKIGARSKL